MERKEHNDNMEEFFRKVFRGLGNEPSEDGWDLPSERAWAGIQSGLAPASRRKAWLLRAAGLLGLILLALLFHLCSRNQQMQARLGQQARTIDSLEEELAVLKGSNIPETRVETGISYTFLDFGRREMDLNKSAIKSEIGRRKAEKPTENAHFRVFSDFRLRTFDFQQGLVQNPNTLTFPKGAGRQEKAIEQQAPEINPVPPAEGQASAAVTAKGQLKGLVSGSPEGQKLQQGKQEPPAVQAGLPNLRQRNPEYFIPAAPGLPARQSAPGPLPTLQLLPASSSPSLRFPEKFSPKALSARRQVHFYGGAYFSYNFTARNIESTGPEAGRPLFPEQESEQWAAEAGLKLGGQLSRRWALETGIGVYTIRQLSQQVFRVPYDPSRERAVEGGAFEASYDWAMPSAYGESEVEFGLRRQQPESVLPGAYIPLELRAEQAIRLVSLPLAVRYDLLAGRLSIGLKGGLALGLLRSASLKVGLQSRHPRLQAPEARIKRLFSEVNNTSLDYLAGLNARYLLAPGWELSLEPAWRSNIRPIAEQAGFLTRSHALGVQVGLNYHFKK